MEDRIERDVVIDAPVERVWELLTEAGHLGSWFGDCGADVDLQPGGELKVRFDEHDEIVGRVVTVEPPTRFAFRWLTPGAPADATEPESSTLVEFTIAPAGADVGTRLSVVESGFAGLALSETDRRQRYASHTVGWGIELGHAADYATQVRA